MRRWLGAAFVGAALGAGLGGMVLFAWAAPPPAADPPKSGFAPDPPPVASTKQWVFEVRAKESVPEIVKVSSIDLEKPEATKRMIGRWALELYVGNELLDRLRFNVPLAGDSPAEKPEPGKKRPEFRVNTKFFVRMADQSRATYVRLVDRATGDVRMFAWPPDKEGKLVPVQRTATPEADAGADAGAADAGPAKDGGSADAGDAGSKDGGAPSDAGTSKDGGRFSPEKP